MNDEIESLYAMLGIKPDEASVNDSVNKLIKDIQSKLKSSIYGGKNGVITLPATIEGKFKNGKEINQDIKDAYVAIYNKAKQMADESVSLTLKDIKDFKAQIDKFSKKTAKYKGSDIIANANNNLRQTLSDYQDFVNDLRKQVSAQQKTQIKQTQKTKAQQNAKTQQKNKTAYDDYLDKQEEYSQQARDAKKQKELFNELDEVKKNKSIGSLGNRVITGVTTEKTLKMSDRSGPYPSNYARQMKLSELAAIKWMKKSLKAFLSENIADDYAKAFTNGMPIQRQIIDKKKNGQVDVRYEDDMYYGQKKMPLTEQQKADEIANSISNELAKILGGLESNRPDASIDQFNKYLEATLQSEKNAKGGYDAILLALNKTFHRYFNTDGTLGITDGSETGVGEDHRQAQKAITGMIKTFKKKLETDFADKVVKVGKQLVNVSAEELRQLKISAKIDPRGAEKELNRILNGTNVSSTKRGSNNKLEQEVDKLTTETKNTTNAIEIGTKETRAQTDYDKIEHSAERVADSVAGKKSSALIEETKEDRTSGFNTDSMANEAIELLRSFENLNDIIGPCETILRSILSEIQRISQKGTDTKNNNSQTKQKTLSENELKILQSVFKPAPLALPYPSSIKPVPVEGTFKNYYDGRDIAEQHRKQRQREREMVENSDISRSTITTTVKDPHSWVTKLRDTFAELTNTTANYEVIMSKTSEEQDKLSAERIRRFGLNRSFDPTDNGDKINFSRRMALWGRNDKFNDLLNKIDLSKGVEIDTTAITDKLAKVLSGPEMFKAQTGGWLNNLAIAGTGGLAAWFQPSLEKSRAQADAVNQIMADIRASMNKALQDILDKESKISGMKQSGELKFNADNSIDKKNSSQTALTVVSQLEESKTALRQLLGDVGMVDNVMKRSHGKLRRITKLLGFTAPMLRKDNAILANINAGLDKNRKST